MSSASHDTSEPAKPLHPNPSFTRWVRHTPYILITQLIAGVAFIASAIYYAFSAWDKGFEKLGIAQVIEINQWLHIPLLLGAAIYLAYYLDANQEGAARTRLLWDLLFGRTPHSSDERWKETWRRMGLRAEDAVRSFKIYFLFFIVSMLVYYAWSLAYHGQVPEPAPKPMFSRMLMLVIDDYVGYVINTLGGSALLLCFLQLKAPQRLLWPIWNSGMGIAVAVVTVLACLLPLGLVLPLVENGQPHNIAGTLKDYMVLLSWVSGVYNAATLMVLISRLDSKLIGLQSWLVGVLYAYAAVQSLFAAFPPEKMIEIKALTLYLVLFLKVYFFFIVHYALMQGRIYCYMVSAPRFRARWDRHRKEERKTVRAHYVAVVIKGILHGGALEKVIAMRKYVIHWFLRHISSLFVGAFVFVTGWGIAGYMMDPGKVEWIGTWTKTINSWHLFILPAALLLFIITWDARTPKNHLYYVNVAKERWRKLHGSFPEWKDTSGSVPDWYATYTNKLPEATERINTWFCMFMYMLFVFYAVQYMYPGVKPNEEGYVDLNTAINGQVGVFLNNATGLFLFLCFLQLARPRSCDRYGKLRMRHARLVWICFAAFTALQLLTVLLWITNVGEHAGEVHHTSILLWETCSGLLVAICFALFTARFDGTLMWQNLAEIRWLMIYAAIQPLLVTFGSGDQVFELLHLLTIIQALILKAWLMVVVWRAIHRGGITSYLLMFPDLDDLTNRIFRNYFLVRMARHSTGNTVEVYHDGQLVFSSVDHCHGHHSYANMLTELKEISSIPANYERFEMNGAYRLVLKRTPARIVYEGRMDFANIRRLKKFIRTASTQLPHFKATYE